MLLFRAVLLLLSITVAAVFAWRIRAPRGSFFTRHLALIWLAWAVELVGLITSQLGIRNAIMYNLYALVEFLVLMSLVRLLRPGWATILLGIGAIGIGAVLLAMWRLGPTRQLALEGILVLGLLCSAVFLRLLLALAGDSQTKLGSTPAFWLFIGALAYFGGIIPIVGAWRFLGELDKELSKTLYWIVIILAIIRYACATVACALEYERTQVAT